MRYNQRKKRFGAGTFGAIIVCAFALLVVMGWVSNIMQIVRDPTPLAQFTAVLIIKVVGIFAAPIGVIMGWIGWFS